MDSVSINQAGLRVMVQVAYTTPAAVAELVKSGKAGSYAVIDVRDEDFAGGNVKGARNVPSAVFEDQLDTLVKELADRETVVFHCALSTQRGPKAARQYAEAKTRGSSSSRKAGPNIEHPPEHSVATGEVKEEGEQQVLVMRGGFVRFVDQYKNDPELVEGYDQAMAEIVGL